MAEIDMSPTDEAILEMLRDGRCTPAYIAAQTDYSRAHVRNRLNRLTEHGIVTRLHKGLYELARDPGSE
jgi:DNA-binding IclR family transcriptional regulator